VDVPALMDPELLAVVRGRPDMDLSDIKAARAAHAARRGTPAAQLSADAVSWRDELIKSEAGHVIRLRMYFPRVADGPLPCLYWNHGGGFVLGNIEQDDQLLCELVASIGCCVASVDWRHAPEHPYPAALHDSYECLRWIADNATSLGIDPTRLVIGGASSGGGLAAGVALLARDHQTPSICYQLLIYPMLDDRMATASSRGITWPKVWNRATNVIAWNAYLGSGHESREVPYYAAPARAPELRGLPPTFIAVGALDVFAGEDIRYAQRLLEADVPTELHVYPGAAHAFDVHVPGAALSRRLAQDRSNALQHALRSQGREIDPVKRSREGT